MSFADFDRVVDRASMHGADLPDPHDLAACLADLAKALSEVDRRMDRIHDFLPPDVRKSIDSTPFLDTFMAYRTLNVHVATLRGSADAYEARAICPYRPSQRSERDAWTAAFENGRRQIERAA